MQYRRKDATPPADWSNATVTGATAVITGLEYGTTYEVEVRSKNSEGASDWSDTGEGTILSSLSVSFSPGSQTVNEGSSATCHGHRRPRRLIAPCPYPFPRPVATLNPTITQ